MSRQDSSPEGAKPVSSAASASRKRTLPAWLDHFNIHDLKILFRCWVAAWIAMLLIFIQPALTNIGQATFFSALVLLVIPPANILFVYILQAFSLLLGMCAAWAWGLLVMKCGLSVRSESERQSLLASWQTKAAEAARRTGQDPAWEAQILVHDGHFLNAKVTAVFFVMGLFFIYVLARLRCANPKLFFFQMFGTIAMDLFILFGPGLPSYQADLAVTLVKPGAIGTALGTTCCLLFFPQSTSYAVLDSLGKLVSLMQKPIELTRRGLQDEELPMEELRATRLKMVSLYKSIGPLVAFLPLDMSRGRWNADDVRALYGQIREAMVAGLSLLDLHITWARSAEQKAEFEKYRQDHDHEKHNHHEAGHRQLSDTAELMHALRDPEVDGRHHRAFELLRDPTSEVFSVTSQSIALAVRCLRIVNSCRWLRVPTQETFTELQSELGDMIATVQRVTDRCVVDVTEGIIEAHSDLFDESGELKEQDDRHMPNLRGIVLGMILEERILNTARRTQQLLEFILRLMELRTEHRLWWPSKLQYALSWLFFGKHLAPSLNSSDAVDESQTSKRVDPDSDDGAIGDPAQEAYRHLRLVRGYKGASARRSPVTRAIIKSRDWLFSVSGMFALRMVVVTLVTAIISVIPHSSGFFYREKGIWVVITAQLCILTYMSDFTFSLLTRIVGTITGGVLGMLVWYIGSGDGTGNPYGLAATTAVVLPTVLWLRIFLPPVYVKATILFGVTFCLVIGFSYDMHHLRLYGLPGVGYRAFWKRLVGVLIGCLVAAVVQIFPKPPSATRHVCDTLSNTTATLADHYALLLSHWGHAEQQSPLGAVAEEISITVADTLLSLSGSIAYLQYEISLTPFDRVVLRDAQTELEHVNQALRRLLNLSTSLPNELQERFSQITGFQEERTIGDVMAVLSLIELALTTGCGLPERLPTPLVMRFYESRRLKNGVPMLNTTLVRDEEYRRYCVALSAYLKFLSSIDSLVLVLKRALGEVHVIHPWEGA